MTDPNRCTWARGSSDLMLLYHDTEWGVPCHDDRALFELLTLEGAQAGLSWNTILNKRENYRRAFDNFNIERVAGYTDANVARLLGDAGIVRNRSKVASAVSNAAAIMHLREEPGSFDAYVWRFVGGDPKVNSPGSLRDIPSRSPESDALSKDLRKRGFRFVGTTICYAFMQAAGLVNDHEVGCFRHGTRSSRTNPPEDQTAAS